MKFYCSHISHDIYEYPGDSPIRLFYSFIVKDFEDMKSELSKIDQRNIIKNLRLEYLTINFKAEGPSTDGKKITLDETFLSFLWSYVYGMVVLFPSGGKTVSKEENLLARDLIKYSHKLLDRFDIWDIYSLPNPEMTTKENDEFVAKTNAIFLYGLNFILLHEFAHAFLGHPLATAAERTDENLKKMEKDADLLATRWMLDSFNNNESEEITCKIGILAALNSLSFSNIKFNEPEKHPSADQRIIAAMELMNLKDNDPIWGFAYWCIMEWQSNHELFSFPSTEFGTNFKAHYYDLIKQLKEFKEKGINTYKIRTNKEK